MAETEKSNKWGNSLAVQCLGLSRSPALSKCSTCVSCSVVSNSVTSWTVAHHVPPTMGFPRREYWSGLPFPSPGKWSVCGASLHVYASLVYYFYSKVISLIIKVNIKLAVNLLFKYKLKLLLQINSNFKNPAMTSDSIQEVLQCYHIAEGVFFSYWCYLKKKLSIHYFILAQWYENFKF